MYRYACEVDYYGVVRLRPHPAINEGAYQRGGLLCCFQQSISAPLRARLYVPLPAKKTKATSKKVACATSCQTIELLSRTIWRFWTSSSGWKNIIPKKLLFLQKSLDYVSLPTYYMVGIQPNCADGVSVVFPPIAKPKFSKDFLKSNKNNLRNRYQLRKYVLYLYNK